MKPTIKNIAEYAGVSRGTVDRVLHGRPNVNPKKRKKIEEALKKLKYTPDRAARALALKIKALKIGVVMPSWTGFFASEVMRGLDAVAGELDDFGIGLSIYRCDTDLPEECVEGIDTLLAQDVRGIAICAKNALLVQKKIKSLAVDGFPIVTYNSDIPGSGRLCYIGQDEIQSGRIAGEIISKLVPKQNRILIVCGNLEFEGHKNRVDGFVDKFRDLGRDTALLDIVETYNDHEITYRKVSGWLENDTANVGVYMANDGISGCGQAILEKNKAGEVRAICHDLSETSVRLLRERVMDFCIEQDLYAQGIKPATIIADYLMAGKMPEHEIEYTRIHIACMENINSLSS